MSYGTRANVDNEYFGRFSWDTVGGISVELTLKNPFGLPVEDLDDAFQSAINRLASASDWTLNQANKTITDSQPITSP